MATSDVYELTAAQTLFGQEVNNVYFYFEELSYLDTNPTHSQTVAETWVDQILPRLTPVQTDDVVYTEIRVRNLFDDSDAYTLGISQPGTITSTNETLGAFEAWSFDLGGTNSAVKNGKKRLAGVPEDWQVDGTFSGDGGQIATMQDAADAMEAPLGIGLIIQDPVYVPVVVKRVRSGISGAYEYRLPETSAESVISKIAVCLWDLLITSQVSRKIGVGI